jgi:hypothetical protein
VVLARLEPDRCSNFQLPTDLAPIRYLSSDCIVTWSIGRLCSFRRSFTSRFQISDLTDSCWVAVNWGPISSENRGFSIATQRILVVLHICKREVKERLNRHNQHIDHVMIRSELKYLIGVKNRGLQWPGFEVEPAPNATVRGCHVVKPLQQFSSGYNPNPELF